MEKDVARGISRMPLILARLYEEDIKFTDTKSLKLSPSSFQREQMSEDEKMIENLGENIDTRNRAARESIKSKPEDDFDFDSVLNEHNVAT